MTKKDYEKIAAALKQAKQDCDRDFNNHVDVHYYYCSNIAYILAADNPRFNRDKFLKACGYE